MDMYKEWSVGHSVGHSTIRSFGRSVDIECRHKSRYK